MKNAKAVTRYLIRNLDVETVIAVDARFRV